MMNIILEDVCAALALNPFDADAAHARMRPKSRRPNLFRAPRPSDKARQAGVLVLLYPNNGALHIALMKRTTVETDPHSGQVSLPGGRREPPDPNITHTALREAYEELGVHPDEVEVLGKLACVYTRSREFEIHPIVGHMPYRPVWRPQPSEVARVLEMPLPALLNETVKAEEEWDRDGYPMRVPLYRWSGEPVWGATGMMLSELEERLRAVLREDV